MQFVLMLVQITNIYVQKIYIFYRRKFYLNIKYYVDN